MNGIINYVKAKVMPITMPPGSVLPGNVEGQYYCYLIDSGLAVIYPGRSRKPLIVINSSHIYGLNQLLYPKGDFVIKIIHSSVIYTIPALSLLSMIEENYQWPALASHLSRLVYALSESEDKERKQHTAALVTQTIEMLQKENEEVRLTYTVLEYVMDITGLSRSTVVRALDILKAQGLIKINNGLLMDFTP